MEAIQSDDASTGRGASLSASTEIGAPRRFSDWELSLASLRQLNHLSKNCEERPVVFLEEA
jgi:hypothetical protein